MKGIFKILYKTYAMRKVWVISLGILLAITGMSGIGTTCIFAALFGLIVNQSILATMISNNSFAYNFILPYTKKKIILSIYLFSLIIYILFFGIALCSGALFSIVNISLRFNLLLIMMAFVICLLYTSIFVPIVVLIPKNSFTFVMLVNNLVYLLFMILFIKTDFGRNLLNLVQQIPANAYTMSILMLGLIAIYGLSYLLTCQGIKYKSF